MWLIMVSLTMLALSSVMPLSFRTARLVFSSIPYKIRTMYSTNTLEACVYVLDHRDVIGDMYEPALIYTKGDKDAFRSDRISDMHALNANGAAKARVLAVASTPMTVFDDDGSPLITRRNLSHRLSLASRRACPSTTRTMRRASPTLG